MYFIYLVGYTYAFHFRHQEASNNIFQMCSFLRNRILGFISQLPDLDLCLGYGQSFHVRNFLLVLFINATKGAILCGNKAITTISNSGCQARRCEQEERLRECTTRITGGIF